MRGRATPARPCSPNAAVLAKRGPYGDTTVEDVFARRWDAHYEAEVMVAEPITVSPR